MQCYETNLWCAASPLTGHYWSGCEEKKKKRKKLLPASLFWCSSTSCLFGEYLQIVKLPYAHTHFCSTFFSWYNLQSQSILSCLTFRVHKKRRRKKRIQNQYGVHFNINQLFTAPRRQHCEYDNESYDR